MEQNTYARREEPLRRDQILDAAIALVAAEGIGALTMRRLASIFGVQAMSLYNHVEHKQDLLDGIAGRLLRSMEIPPVGTMSWQDALRAVCRSYRRLAHAHPALFPHVHARPLTSPEALPPLEAVLTILTDEGFDADTALDVFRICASYVEGFALSEISNGLVEDDGRDPWEGLPPFRLVKDRFPVTANIVMTANPDFDRAFELGLDLLVQGLDRLPRR